VASEGWVVEFPSRATAGSRRHADSRQDEHADAVANFMLRRRRQYLTSHCCGASTMKPVLLLTVIVALTAALSRPAATPAAPPETGLAPIAPAIPASVRAEHEAIHAALVAATKAPGGVGTAAQALAKILHPHFEREEQIALPPLGLLARLAAGDRVPDAELSEALTMADTLKREMPRMLEEHERIRAAVGNLRKAAAAAGARAQEEFTAELALHAQTEEEVLYPAAILVADVVRARQRAK
jgi:Hemerythrin HHE cation binding domain